MKKLKKKKQIKNIGYIVKSVTVGMLSLMILSVGFLYKGYQQNTTDTASSVLASKTNTTPVILYEATLNAAQETPPTSSTAIGKSIIFFSPQTNQATVMLSFQNFSGTEASVYLHGPAGMGVSVKPIRQLPLGNPLLYSTTLNSQEITYLQKGLLYINVNSDAYPNGEVRGQYSLLAFNLIYSAALSPKDAATNTSATGQSILFLSPITGQGIVLLSLQSLSSNEISANIQSMSGDTSQPIIEMPNGGFVIYPVNLTPEQLVNVKSGFSITVASQKYPNGELSGQYNVVPFDSIFIANLNAAQQSFPTASTAVGQSLMFFSPENKTAMFFLSLGNLSSTETAVFLNGTTPLNTIASPITQLPPFNPLIYTTQLNDQEMQFAQSGSLYISVESQNYPNGEITGKYLPLVQSTKAQETNNGTTAVITGKITNTLGNNISPATINVSTGNQAYTDKNGNYSITLTNTQSVTMTATATDFLAMKKTITDTTQNQQVNFVLTPSHPSLWYLIELFFKKL